MTVEIRDVEGLPEYEACARMQVDVWGFTEFEVVPAGHLIAMHHYGGTCVGAFDGERMVGFVCGFPGIEHDRVFHHSHMLAVIPEYRGRRIGESLKWTQRERVMEQGLDLINWTFDPLQAGNANLNINLLGAIARRYKVNLYGESDSPLHGGLPTDRFEAEWNLKSQRVVDALSGNLPEPSGWESLPRANRTRRSESGLLVCEPELDLDLDEDAFLVEIPRAVTELMREDRELAHDWRQRTRVLFQEYFQKGYRVQGLHRTDDSAFYRMEREPTPME